MRGLKGVILAIAVIIVLLVAGMLLYRYFVTDRIMDRGGMENPDASDVSESESYLVDGDYTYVDNEALLLVITGSWESTDGHWRMTLDDDCRVTLAFDGEAVLDSHMDFTYLQPGEVLSTEFSLDSSELKRDDGTVLGEIDSLRHEAGTESGSITAQVTCEDGDVRTLEFEKEQDKNQ